MTASPASAPSEDYSVLTPERVSLQFDIAGIGSRAAAALIDVAIQAVSWIALLIVAGLGMSRFAGSLDDAGPVGIGALLILAFLGGFFLLWGYYIAFEIAWSGQTPGKRAMGLRVIRENGYPIRPSDAIVRNLIRIVDGPPFSFVIGAFVMLLNERSRRLGDYAAGTIVVREAQRRRLDQLPSFSPTGSSMNMSMPNAPATTSAIGTPSTRAFSGLAPAGQGAPGALVGQGTPVAMSAEDSTLVRDFLVRRQELDHAARETLARRLAGHIAARYGLPPPESTGSQTGVAGEAERFLERLTAG